MGTANTMQCMAEALGLALAGSALVPATMSELQFFARRAGRTIMELVRRNHPSNRHSDAAGLPQCNYRTQRDRRFDQRPDPSAGNREGAWYGAGSGAVLMRSTKDSAHRKYQSEREAPDGILLVCGRHSARAADAGRLSGSGCDDGDRKTLGENLEELEKNSFFEIGEAICKLWPAGGGCHHSFGDDGGNGKYRGAEGQIWLPEGAVVKYSAHEKSMRSLQRSCGRV